MLRWLTPTVVGIVGTRAAAAAIGLLIDRALGEPPSSLHPVAWFGSALTRVEERVWADRRGRGVAYAAIGTTVGAAAGRLARSTGAVVAVTVAGRELRRTAERIGSAAAADDLIAARARLPSLVGRDPSELDSSGIAAAVVESVAENSVDAVIAPVFWAVVAGAPGAAAYRAINTMDAMVGRRNERYEHFGWAAARLDDAANYVPARLFAALVMAIHPRRMAEILAVVRRDAPAHPSPNAGVAEAAIAAALGCQLGGPLQYGAVIEDRPTLGSGPRPTPADVQRATAIAQRVENTVVVLLVFGWLLGRAGRRSL